MLGLMQDRPLLISSLIEFAALHHRDEEIVSRTVEGPVHRYTYKDCAMRSRQLAKSLEKLGVAQSDRIGTLAWNGTVMWRSITGFPVWALSATPSIRGCFLSRLSISSTMRKTNIYLWI